MLLDKPVRAADDDFNAKGSIAGPVDLENGSVSWAYISPSIAVVTAVQTDGPRTAVMVAVRNLGTAPLRINPHAFILKTKHGDGETKLIDPLDPSAYAKRRINNIASGAILIAALYPQAEPTTMRFYGTDGYTSMLGAAVISPSAQDRAFIDQQRQAAVERYEVDAYARVAPVLENLLFETRVDPGGSVIGYVLYPHRTRAGWRPGSHQ